MDIWINMLAALVLSGVLSWGLIPFAYKVGLVDNPCERKRHNGNIPLVGGLAVFATTVVVFLTCFNSSTELRLFTIASGFMVLIGMIDDRYDLSVGIRIAAQLLISSIIVLGADNYINHLGDLFGMGLIELGAWGIPFTLLCIMAAMNAYNMIDGIDGLLGTMAMIAFVGIAMLGFINNQHFTVNAALVVSCALLPFLMRNTGFPVKTARKIFMGDAGSMFIGLAIVWLLTLLTDPAQINDRGISVRPVAVLWLIAIPLMDMLAIIFRRMANGRSPFKPDRDHLHHILMRAGFNPKRTLIIIASLATGALLFGLMLEILAVPEPAVAFIFVGLFVLYSWVLSNSLKVVAKWRDRVSTTNESQ